MTHPPPPVPAVEAVLDTGQALVTRLQTLEQQLRRDALDAKNWARGVPGVPLDAGRRGRSQTPEKDDGDGDLAANVQ